jgi:hypothetical protein
MSIETLQLNEMQTKQTREKSTKERCRCSFLMQSMVFNVLSISNVFVERKKPLPPVNLADMKPMQARGEGIKSNN